jgi:serine/threonine-protein phosphatase 2B catalytic subunit
VVLSPVPAQLTDERRRSRRLDIANERLPEYYAPTSFPYVPVPSMRQPLAAHMQRGWGSGSTTPTGEGDGTPEPSPGAGADVPGAWPGQMPMEELIKRRIDDDDVGDVERMAERFAHSSRRASPSPSAPDRPRPLKRHETA